MKKSKKKKHNQTGVVKVSQSRVNSYLRCAYMHHLRYNEKLRRRRIKRPFQFGRIVHDMLEADANNQDPFKVLEQISLDNAKLFAAEREMYGEIIEDIGIIMEEYFAFWDDDDMKLLKKNGKRAEHWFEIELEDGILWNGKIDACADAGDMRWLVENKTGATMLTDDHRWRNFQSVTYIRAIEMLGWWKKKPLEGTIWNFIRSKPPTRPQVLKSGEGFSARAIDTLPTVVKEVISEAGFKLKDHKDLLQKAKDNRSNYFKRIRTPLNRGVIDKLFGEFVESSIEVRDNGHKNIKKTIGRHCDYCDMEPICRAELQGSDVDHVKEREFYVHQKDEEAEEGLGGDTD